MKWRCGRQSPGKADNQSHSMCDKYTYMTKKQVGDWMKYLISFYKSYIRFGAITYYSIDYGNTRAVYILPALRVASQFLLSISIFGQTVTTETNKSLIILGYINKTLRRIFYTYRICDYHPSCTLLWLFPDLHILI